MNSKIILGALSAYVIKAYNPNDQVPSRAPTADGVVLGQVIILGTSGL